MSPKSSDFGCKITLQLGLNPVENSLSSFGSPHQRDLLLLALRRPVAASQGDWAWARPAWVRLRLGSPSPSRVSQRRGRRESKGGRKREEFGGFYVEEEGGFLGFWPWKFERGDEE